MTMAMAKRVLVLLAVCASAVPARAQDGVTAPAAGVSVPTTAPTQCELHVWPAERFFAMTTSLLGGGLLDYAVHEKKDKNNRSQMASALDSESQLDALGSLDLLGLLKLPPATIVKHEKPLDRHTMNKIKERRADSQSPCYSELIVADLFYQKAAIYGRSLRALFMLREFGAASMPTRIYKSWGGNGLKLFPPKKGEDEKPAMDELVRVFKANFEEYARDEVRNREANSAPKVAG